MRDISHKRNRFLGVVRDYSSLYVYSNQKEQLTLTAGVLNFIWNNWNIFWREYWIAHVSGGYDLSSNKITPIFPKISDNESCAYLLFLCNRRNTFNKGDKIAGNYQEPTWGDPKIIIKIASKMTSAYNTEMTYLLSMLSIYQTDIEHFQKIRNSFIHLNNENIFNLNSLTGYYTFSNNQKLIDILESTSISTRKRCFDSLLSSMSGMLLNL